MTMGDDGDGECLALSLCIYATVSFLFGLKNGSSYFFLLVVFRQSWKQKVRTYGFMNPLKG